MPLHGEAVLLVRLDFYVLMGISLSIYQYQPQPAFLSNRPNKHIHTQTQMEASAPGFMYYYPWESWGNFKYLLYAPLLAGVWYTGVIQGCSLIQNTCFHVLLIVALRYLLFQAWTTISRLPYFARKYQIQTKGIKFEQIDHEANWENLLMLTAITLWAGAAVVVPVKGLPAWDWWGLPIVLLMHIGPVEWLYYWGHRALHHHFLFTRYHQHHHSSFVPQPITSSNHPFIEVLFYEALFSIPILTSLGLGHSSLGIIYFYILFIDFMNAWGHCNIELIPVWAFKTFWPLKYIIYSPTFHSLHHSKVHTNFSLFMPLYDYLYGTVDASSDSLHENVRQRGSHEMKVDCVYLTHATDLLSTFHLQFGFQKLAAKPYSKKWYMWIMWPLALSLMLLSWLFAKPFVGATHFLGNKLELQSWVIPRFSFQYHLSSEAARIDGWIRECIVQAREAGAKVIALALLNKNRKLDIDEILMYKEDVNIAVVTGDTLAASIVAKTVEAKQRDDVREVFITSAQSRVGQAIATYLCEHGFKVLALLPSKEHAEDLRTRISLMFRDNFVYVTGYEAAKTCKVWVVGDQIGCKVQKLAPKGAHFYEFGLFPIHRWRKDCFYSGIPGLRLPENAQTINACEDVMPRLVVRTSYAAAMLHLLGSLQYHDYQGDISLELMSQSWDLAIKHGFSIEY